ncbi:methyltransferase [Saccharomonospora piscinae]|uniref:Methyltransferase n=1 Tax=Saccharomonospora piscinae TaxID=687388 RepID=A0A1V9A5L2_SACPI|nr:class I SAM-dependent methyltransferase [Saccharomonospora piscinae]OQO92214.1 methyltransferase [Saccharomonospora piscinae]
MDGEPSRPPESAAEDRLRWNARYRRATPSFEPHPLADAAWAAGLPPGPVLELACGRSGSALALAERGRHVLAVDVSDVALAQLACRARQRRPAGQLACVRADLRTFVPRRATCALVLSTRFWDPDVFRTARQAVLPGGLLAWEALADSEEAGAQPRPYRVRHGALGAALGPGWEVLAERRGPHATTSVLARATP